METRILVTGMTCMHCAAAVTKALQRVPGVEGVDVRLADKQAVVQGHADPAALVEAIKAEGYGAELAA